MDYKSLLRQVQATVDSIQATGENTATIAEVAETIAENFRELGITGGRLYECRDESYLLVHRFGDQNGDLEMGIEVPVDYKPIVLAVENGIVVMEPNDPGVDRELEDRLGAKRFAAISVGDRNYILSFNVPEEASREDILFSLNLVRYSINQKLRAERYEALIAEAQRIQQSILPQRVPDYQGYDIFGKTVPAEIVSGDFFDYIPVSDSVLGLAIADASGHGLPAALVVRDVYMGLRMGVERDVKIIKTIEKLNRILHRSRLTTKYVSLFYGELESGGTLIYTNAGHNPPFLIKQDRIELLDQGGRILGPTPDATYTRGYVRMQKGDILCLYTDGIVEAHGADGSEFGLDRLQECVLLNRELPSQEIVHKVLSAVHDWGRQGEDDRTMVVVKAAGV